MKTNAEIAGAINRALTNVGVNLSGKELKEATLEIEKFLSEEHPKVTKYESEAVFLSKKQRKRQAWKSANPEPVTAKKSIWTE